MQAMNIVGRRKWYYLLSSVLLIPGVVALILWGLPLGIDFTGGSLMELKFNREVTVSEVNSALAEIGFGDSVVQVEADQIVVIKTRTLEGSGVEAVTDSTAEVPATEEPAVTLTDAESAVADETVETVETETTAQPVETVATAGERGEIIAHLSDRFGTVEEISFESIGPVVSRELTWQAINSVLIASLAIILYIAWAFRHVPKPASSYRFGVTAILALVHDIFFLLGVFAILGRFMNIEVDALFVVAALTVMGFSVHDSIVVFDRIREKLRVEMGQPFEVIANHSILETLGRSINTSFTVLLVLLAMLLFGGESIRDFNLALLVGIIVGSYSSIFFAAPFLVDWQNWVDKRSQGMIRK